MRAPSLVGRGFLAAVLLAALIPLSACMDSTEDKEIVRIGLIAPLSTFIPELSGASESFVRVAQTAIEEINANGGINGRELVLIVRDPDFPISFPTKIVEIIEELDTMGVVGAIGPVTTATASFAVPAAMEHDFPLISPSSTGAGLAEAEDGGFMFRNATNDKIQGLVMADFLTTKYDDPATEAAADPVNCVYVMHEVSDYANDFANAFADIYRDEMGNQIKHRQAFSGAEGVPIEDDFLAVANADPCDPQNPDARRDVILITVNHPVTAINLWNDMTPRPNFRWVLSDGARTPGFVAAAPDSLDGVVGTAPTNPILGDAFEELEDAFADRYADERIAELVFTPQVWDAVFLFAAGLTLQDQRNPGGVFGGLGLARAIRDISKGPGVILHAGQWRDFLSAVESGATVDFDGASGPSDFDNCGETVGPYEIYRVFRDAATDSMTSEQIRFLSTASVEALRQPFAQLANQCDEF